MPKFKNSHSGTIVFLKGIKKPRLLKNVEKIKKSKRRFQVLYSKNSLRGFIQRNFYKMTSSQMSQIAHKPIKVIENAMHEMRKVNAIVYHEEIKKEYLEQLNGEKPNIKVIEKEVKKEKFLNGLKGKKIKLKILKKTLGISEGQCRIVAKKYGIIIEKEPTNSESEKLREFFRKNWGKVERREIDQRRLAFGRRVHESIVSRAVKAVREEKRLKKN